MWSIREINLRSHTRKPCPFYYVSHYRTWWCTYKSKSVWKLILCLNSILYSKNRPRKFRAFPTAMIWIIIFFNISSWCIPSMRKFYFSLFSKTYAYNICPIKRHTWSIMMWKNMFMPYKYWIYINIKTCWIIFVRYESRNRRIQVTQFIYL